MFERAKTVHVLDRAVTVIGFLTLWLAEIIRTPSFLSPGEGGEADHSPPFGAEVENESIRTLPTRHHDVVPN
jgi:hypothetical protein